MTPDLMHDPNIKPKLLEACRQYVERRIATATLAMNEAQSAANEEGKSSAGDKYETGRAMMQIERDKAAVQVEEAVKLLRVLDQINPQSNNDRVSLGSVVFSPGLNIFLAVGAGKSEVDGLAFIAVAPASPLGKAMMGLKVGDSFAFKGQSFTISGIL